MERALRVVFLRGWVSLLVVGEGGGKEGEGKMGGRGSYSSEALPKTVEMPRIRIAGW